MMVRKWESWVGSLEGPYRETVDHCEYQTADAAYLNQLEADKAALLEALEEAQELLRIADWFIVPMAFGQHADTSMGARANAWVRDILNPSRNDIRDLLSRFRSEGAGVKAGE